jgi:NAD(P)-dependent dehydrogenase (short-subunit alcohol dehydrogenase family)
MINGFAADRVAIVVGGAGFIGGAICREMATHGATIVVADLDESKLAATTEGLIADGGRALAVRCDVRNGEDIAAMLTRTYDEFGRADYLVNVPAIWPPTPFLEISKSEWDEVMAINLDGVFLCSQAFAREAVDRGTAGKIVNITSGAARIVRPDVSHYSASKAAVDSLTRSMAIELAPYGFCVNALNPGVTENDFNARTQRERPAEHRTKMAKIPLGRMGKPDEAAGVVAFLLSPAADYMTGCIIDQDGGYTLGIPAYTT